MNQQLEEFKNRLKETVRKCTCDMMTDEAIKTYAEKLSENEKLNLILVLNGQYNQLIHAVLNQK